MAEIYRAVEAFAYGDKGGVPRSVSPGDLMSSDDPGYKGREHLFEPVEVAAARQAGKSEPKPKVEEASAEPNVKRSVSTVRRGPVGKGEAK